MFKNINLAELLPFVDWTPYFQTWDLAGRFPAILDDAVVGEQAKKVYADAQAMLHKIVEERWLTANAVFGFWPANTVRDDDIECYADENREEVVLTWHNLRQQSEKGLAEDGQYLPSRCLADFIAPRQTAINTEAAQAGLAASNGKNTSKKDYLGAFAVTAGLGCDEKVAEFMAQMDDYNAILLKALADRLAEATAEWLHWRVRTDLWGYAKDEGLDNDALIAEKYQGIRPAPGYPSCPDHSIKAPLFDLLKAEEIDMGLTDSMAMTPAASVSGFYFSHPDSHYFLVGKVGEDQASDLAERSGVPLTQLKRFLGSNL